MERADGRADGRTDRRQRVGGYARTDGKAARRRGGGMVEWRGQELSQGHNSTRGRAETASQASVTPQPMGPPNLKMTSYSSLP